jgi:hypothetical protein
VKETHKDVKKAAKKEEQKMSQEKVSIPSDEWKLVLEYYEKHKEELKLQGIGSPTKLLRNWMLEKYRENISHESKK